MIAMISNNAVTIIVLAVLAILTGGAVFALVRGKKRRKGGCTCGCDCCGADCPYKRSAN